MDSNSVKQDFDSHDKNNLHQKTTVNHDVRRGDQAIGGVHVFEFHAPGGGMGIGIKLLVLTVIAIAICYWCLKEKCSIFARRYAPYNSTPVQRTVAGLENAVEMCACNTKPESTRRSGRDIFEP